jgi:hypothetical protein
MKNRNAIKTASTSIVNNHLYQTDIVASSIIIDTDMVGEDNTFTADTIIITTDAISSNNKFIAKKIVITKNTSIFNDCTIDADILDTKMMYVGSDFILKANLWCGKAIDKWFEVGGYPLFFINDDAYCSGIIGD